MKEKSLKKDYHPGKKIKLIFQIVFFTCLIILALYYILKDDPVTTFKIISEASFFPLSLAIIALLTTIILDAASLTILAKLYNKKYKFSQGLINALSGGLVGVFVKSAAPLLQAQVFPKQNIKTNQGASIVTMNFMMYQFSLIVYSVLFVSLGYPIMRSVPLDILWDIKVMYFVVVGLSVQLFFLIAAILLAYCGPFHRFVLNTGVNLLSKLHLLKNPDEKRRRWTIQFATYRIEMKRLGQNFKEMSLSFLFNILKQFLLCTIPFLCFYSLIPESVNWSFFTQCITGTAYTNVISSFITVGVPELIFQDTFTFFLSQNGITNAASCCSACNLLWRTLTFYLLFFLGLFTYIFYRGSPKPGKILSDTSTLYDLSFALLKEEDIDDDLKKYLKEIKKDGNSDKASLLSKEEIMKQFSEIKGLDDEQNEGNDEDSGDYFLDIILDEQKSNLADIYTEYDELVKNQPTKGEIDAEIDKYIAYQKKKDDKKMEKKIDKEKRMLEKRQPYGSTVTFDEKSGINIESPEIEEMKTLTTQDPEEGLHQRKKEQ